MPGDAAKPLGEPLRVAVLATRRNLGAATHRVPGRVSPLDGALVAHRTIRIMNMWPNVALVLPLKEPQVKREWDRGANPYGDKVRVFRIECEVELTWNHNTRNTKSVGPRFGSPSVAYGLLDGRHWVGLPVRRQVLGLENRDQGGVELD